MAANIAPSTYTALTVSGRSARVTHLWVGLGNLCQVEFTMAPNVRQLQKNTICKACAALQDLYDAAQQAAEADRDRIMNTERARRLTSGQSIVTGWELLYDKPTMRMQVGRRDKNYALICTDHRFAKPLERLQDERGLRKGGNRSWCPACCGEAADAEA
ncbi:hypothetical protein ACFPC0_10615 [Streptomyces andamanensis]|uniref:Uncharacterized protein n=1 Tax=Streptomyces andamanensis TaxID=1565035 RepID=A0ABV8TCI4_9ACTN